MFKITNQEWNDIHKDYKSIIENKRYILVLDDLNGTCLVPVEVTKENIDTSKDIRDRYLDDKYESDMINKEFEKLKNSKKDYFDEFNVYVDGQDGLIGYPKDIIKNLYSNLSYVKSDKSINKEWKEYLKTESMDLIKELEEKNPKMLVYLFVNPMTDFYGIATIEKRNEFINGLTSELEEDYEL